MEDEQDPIGSSKIFVIVNDEVIINLNVLTVPQLKAVYQKYQSRFNALLYVHHSADHTGPYANMTEDEKREELTRAYKGDYHPQDAEILDAIDFVKRSRYTTTTRSWEGNKRMMDRLSLYMSITEIDDDAKDGNLGNIIRLLQNSGKTTAQFKQLEDAKNAEDRGRGDRDVAWDLEN